MANVEGTYSASYYESGRVMTDLREKIFLLNPAATPFLTFSQKLEGDPTTTMPFEWFEDAFLTWTDTAKSAAAANATTVYVNNADRYAVDMIVWNKTTDEHYLVTSVVSASDYILVTREFGETASATVLANDSLVILGPAANEGATSQSGLITTKTSGYNYCQEFRWPWEMTERAIATKTRTRPGGWTFESMKAADEHKLQIERSLLFGERKDTVASTMHRFATRGLQNWVAAANVYDVGGNLGEFDFDDWIRSVFRAGTGEAVSNTKILLANDILVEVISRYPKLRMQTTGDETVYGVPGVTTYRTPHGKLKIVYHRMLDDAYSTTGYGLVYDPANVRLRYFVGEKLDGHTVLHEGIQANDATKLKNEYRTTVGLEVKHTTTHGEIKNVYA